ncbi:MAG: uracil-DNA glycosylase [Chloroflexota bacterium]|nr:uracil-DNA glycosylase [Chloroflexota bacterium]
MTQPDLFQANYGPSLDAARRDALDCRRCDLWRSGTRTVFGSGSADAQLMLIGEAPAEADDRTGLPFSGPSGAVLDAWLEEIGLTRGDVWLTNVVKHRPTVVENGREKNRPPRAGEANACRVWLDIELSHVRPSLILALGGTAGKALLGKGFKITQQRGRVLPGPGAIPVIATFHPAYILRLEPPELQQAEKLVSDDLALVGRELKIGS